LIGESIWPIRSPARLYQTSREVGVSPPKVSSPVLDEEMAPT